MSVDIRKIMQYTGDISERRFGLMQWNLIRLRKENGLTQDDMAKILGIGKRTYVDKEHGVRPFTADEMIIIRNYFGVKMDDFILPSNVIKMRIGKEATQNNAKNKS